MTAPKHSLLELAALAYAEAARIETTQDALVASGLRSAPDVGKLRDAASFAALGRLVDLARGDYVIMDRLRHLTAAAPAQSKATTP